MRRPIAANAGQLEHYDCEYKRNGTVSLFIFLDARTGPWRKVDVTDSRAAVGFAACMRDPRRRSLLEGRAHPGGAEQYVHPLRRRALPSLPAGQSATPPVLAQFHYVPKHTSWLSMVEIEIGVLCSQCLERRIQCTRRILSEVAVWERQRNASRARGCSQWRMLAPKHRAYTSRSSAKEA